MRVGIIDKICYNFQQQGLYTFSLQSNALSLSSLASTPKTTFLPNSLFSPIASFNSCVLRKHCGQFMEWWLYVEDCWMAWSQKKKEWQFSKQLAMRHVSWPVRQENFWLGSADLYTFIKSQVSLCIGNLTLKVLFSVFL